jgi:hypothetical protein
MPERDWLNVNNFLHYPLVEGDRTLYSGSELPKEGIADAGFVLGIDSGFIPGDHDVFLYAAWAYDDRIELDFRADAPGMSGYRWLFPIPAGTAEGTSVHRDAEHISLASESPDRGEGFVTVGRIESLHGVLPAGGDNRLVTALNVEPALIQSLYGAAARSIGIANDARLCPDANCGSSLSSSVSAEEGDTFAMALNLIGALKFREGYNASVEVIPSTNVIEINARVGLGAGEPCEDVIIDENGFQRGEECVNCDRFIGSINGVVMGKDVTLQGTPGVCVVPDPDNHKIIMTIESGKVCVERSSSSA